MVSTEFEDPEVTIDIKKPLDLWGSGSVEELLSTQRRCVYVMGESWGSVELNEQPRFPSQREALPPLEGIFRNRVAIWNYHKDQGRLLAFSGPEC